MKRLQEWMEQHDGMSQVDLARQMNVSPALVSLMLSGKREINENFIGRFFLVFGPEEAQAVFGDLATVAAAVEEA
jgi:plasmid maintenance system antidote protein VapI